MNKALKRTVTRVDIPFVGAGGNDVNNFHFPREVRILLLCNFQHGIAKGFLFRLVSAVVLFAFPPKVHTVITMKTDLHNA